MFLGGWCNAARWTSKVTTNIVKFRLSNGQNIKVGKTKWTGQRTTRGQQEDTKQELRIKNKEIKTIRLPDKPAIGEVSSKKRQNVVYPQKVYALLNKTYATLKGIEPRGKEWDPIMQNWKTMLMSGRTPDEIIECMNWLAKANQEWTYGWTYRTVKMKIAEYLGGTLEDSNFNPILRDPMFKKLQGVYFAHEGTDWQVKSNLLERLGRSYPLPKFTNQWSEARKVLNSHTEEAEKKQREYLDMRESLAENLSVH